MNRHARLSTHAPQTAARTLHRRQQRAGSVRSTGGDGYLSVGGSGQTIEGDDLDVYDANERTTYAKQKNQNIKEKGGRVAWV